jgi:AraC-like DNA-binding protein
MKKNSFLKLGYPSPGFDSWIEYYFELDAQYSQQKIVSIIGIPAVNTLIGINLGQTSWRSRNVATGKELTLSAIEFLGHTTNCFTGVYSHAANVFYIKLKPGKFSKLFPYPAQSIENNQIQVSDVFKSFSLEQFQSQPSFGARIRWMENYLTGLTYRLMDLHKQHVIDQILKKFNHSPFQGIDTIDKLCKDHHITYATLRRYFIDQIGVSPKFCQKTIKFKQALQAYRSYGYTFSYEDYGYSDFSHFCKDAKQLTGAAPSLL